ncbi:hypothetical protein [Francisella philomiragia]|uniref:hypothetical protein n=1 Tax=Francisella philomiragia TaxID=28110 RepID=UPI001C9D95B5|nr:hypothetical protein [Francisella philomiragia]MBY7733450.1 hypothetical protein [Francisella philomiragia]
MRKFDKLYKKNLYEFPNPGLLLYQIGFTNPFSYRAMIRFPFYRMQIYIPRKIKKNKKNHLRYNLMPNFEDHITWVDRILYIGGIGLGTFIFIISGLLIIIMDKFSI